MLFEPLNSSDSWKTSDGFLLQNNGLHSLHSYTDDLRYSNTDSVEEYIYNTRIGKSEDNLIFHEKQDKMSKMKEYMILGLRNIEGVNCFDFIAKFRENPKDVFSEELNKLADLGLLDIEKNIKLTDKGIDLANIVWEEFI